MLVTDCAAGSPRATPLIEFDFQASPKLFGDAYTATWAALLAIQAHNQRGAGRIDVVAFPAMGTGFGGVPYSEAARQMAVAYRHFLEPPHRLDWDFVVQRQLAICYDE